MSGTHDAQNSSSRQRLRKLVARLDDDALKRPIDDDWTVGAALAHLAFWDASCVARWDEFDRTGAFPALSREVVDLINATSLPQWRALPGRTAAELAVEAAEAADGRTAAVTDAALAYVEANGRGFILDRAAHRTAHLDEIERVLGEPLAQS